MSDNWSDLKAEVQAKKDADDTDDTGDTLEVGAGDTCPEYGCPRSVHAKTHPKRSEETEPHPDAPIVEMVCLHHGIVDKTFTGDVALN